MSVMKAKVAIFSKDTQAQGAGIQLCYEDKTYAIISLYLPKTDYPSVRRVLPRIFSEVFRIVPEDVQTVVFTGTIPYFRDNVEEMKRKAGIYAGNIKTDFHRVRRSSWESVELSIDAVERRSSIIEVL